MISSRATAGRRGCADTEPDARPSLNEALARSELEFPRQAKAVKLRYFGRLKMEEVGETLAISAPTTMRDLRFAQAWLARVLTAGA